MNRRTFIKVGSLWLASAPAIVRAIPPQYIAALQKPQAAPVVSGGAGSVPNPSDFFGYWSCNAGSGNSVVDSSANANNGDLTGHAPSWVSGKFGNGLSFSGSDQYVDCGIPSAINSIGEFSLAAWIKSPIPSASYAMLVTKSDSADHGFEMRMDGTGGKIDLVCGTGSAATSDPVIVDNTWTHLVVTYKATVDQYIYVNGSEALHAGAGVETASSAGQHLLFGARYESGTPAYFFNGLIDEVVIYTRQLSSSEVTTLYNWIP